MARVEHLLVQNIENKYVVIVDERTAEEVVIPVGLAERIGEALAAFGRSAVIAK